MQLRDAFGSEARRFTFVLAAAAAVGAVALADVLAPAGVLVAVAALAIVGVAAVYLHGGSSPQGLPTADAHPGAPTARRTLLLVDELPLDVCLSSLGQQADRVLIVSLAGTSSVRHMLSDLDPARARARIRMEDAVSRNACQVDARAVIEEDNPFTAIDDALRTFGGDEIVVASGDTELINRLRHRYAIPVAPAREA